VVWIVAHNGRLYVHHHAWVSRDGVVRVDQSQNLVKYSKWEGCSWLTICHGNTVDPEDMRAFIRNLAKQYRVRSIALDPSRNANDTFLSLKGSGLPVEMYGTSPKYMNEPMRRLSDLVDNHTLAHPGDELIQWQAQNLESRKNSADQLVPCKPGESHKIDTMVALMYALAVYLRGVATPEKKYNPAGNKWQVW
jgi:phage terminase large subunit-like protein